MAKYSLSTLTSIFLPKNVRKNRDNLPESRVTLVPHADAISLYHAVKDINEYLNITPGSGTTDLTSTPSSTNVVIESSSGDDATIVAATTTDAGVMSAADKTNLGALITLSGVAAASTHLGTFTGATIPNSSTIKAALQALETALEAGTGSYTDEDAQDAVGNILTDGVIIEWSYNDSGPTISADIIDGSIDFSKIQDISSQRLLGRTDAGAGVIDEISLHSSLTFSSGALAHGDTSSVSNSSNSGATVIQSMTFDTYGHVQTVTTKTLSAADLSAVDGTGGANRVAYWLDGNTLTSDSDFTFNGSGLAINTTLAASHVLTVGGATKTQTLTIHGTGTLGSSLASAELRLDNTTPSTGQVWYLTSNNDGTLNIASSAINPELTIDTNGDLLVENKLQVGDLAGTATGLLGKDASGYLKNVTIGSGLVFSSGTLSASGGGGGGGYDTIQEDGVTLTPYTTLNFLGDAITASDNVVDSTTDVELHPSLESIAALTLADGDILYYTSGAFQKLTPVKDAQDVTSGTAVILPSTPAVNSLVDVFRNGVLQEETDDYTIAGDTLTFVTAFTTGEKVTTNYFE